MIMSRPPGHMMPTAEYDDNDVEYRQQQNDKERPVIVAKGDPQWVDHHWKVAPDLCGKQKLFGNQQKADA